MCFVLLYYHIVNFGSLTYIQNLKYALLYSFHLSDLLPVLYFCLTVNTFLDQKFHLLCSTASP